MARPRSAARSTKEALPAHARQGSVSQRARRKVFEDELRQRLKDRAARDHERREASRALHRPLFEGLSTEALEEMRKASRRLATVRDRQRKVKAPRPPKPGYKPQPGTRLGSFVQTWTAPYDFDWTPNSSSGSPFVGVSADRSNGTIGFDLLSASNNASSADAWGGVGVFWEIPSWLDESMTTLKLSANVSFGFSWDDSCAYASSHTDGSLVLNMDVFDSAGGWQGLAISQPSLLWSDDAWWRGGSNSGTNSSFGLSGQAQVDDSHFYNLWVFVNGNISADGSSDDIWSFWWSTASGSISATVNSITAEFG